ncbi:MAG: hypothetical protein UV73_C0006G0027 [Candidatus Gottesmanbacteria bacterium GW2011_GWA2_43_14]|uniref:DUF5652 domain-containing protein n=1 Tax=Candidatus Gottesmanbacteria bacterium GW2011_GWA2_43_14 TaxID=1618443 RepID=A0A0G1GFR5_9BACT|nr:MAG: hypothetical protein UV73_C0006G0027 [Candidatus Gottesmanbacteria bacterium GW2011_GWA2_43_14]
MPNFFPENRWLFLPVLLLEMVLKGFALWKAARREQKYWFIALLVLNTVGILPLIYLLFFSEKIHFKQSAKPSKRK